MDDIRPVEGTRRPGDQGGGDSPPIPWAQGERRQPRPRLDQAELTEPPLATLRLIRERVLDSTRHALDLPRAPGGPQFVGGDVERVDLFVGRLLSDQNLLASRRAGQLPPEQIREALSEGMIQGLSETLEILCELNELDKTCWELVCDVLNDFCRKVQNAAADI